ncbi:hypothetical protein SLE2022_189110 [Rubroshorea leprosula]
MLCHLILSATILFAAIQYRTFAYEDPRAYAWNAANANTPNSSFSTNLKEALDILQDNTAATGFSTITIPSKTNPVTGLALCRATLSPTDCQECVVAAVLGIRLVCSNQTAAQVWYTYCMLRYSATNFINKTDDSNAFILYDTRVVPYSYYPTVDVFLQNLSSTAGMSEKRYAIAQTKEPDDHPVYGYMDCTRDVDGESCRRCLLTAIGRVDGCCLGKWAAWVATPTCNIQFHMEPVHKDWETAPFIQTFLSPAPPPEIPATPPPEIPATTPPAGRRSPVVLGVSVAVAGVFVVVAGLWFLIKGRNILPVIMKGRWWVAGEGERDIEKREEIETRKFLFDLDALVTATDNFSEANLLGRGGFGSVYKGTLPSGERIAVKKLAATNEGLDQVHRNLVQLLGCCIHGEERMLVYEHLPNKSLDYFLFDKSKSAILDWQKRHEIILGVARGLVYLHQDAVLKIIHRDIKASNILLDEGIAPKISDFGLAKLFKDEQSHLRTHRIVGTFGYMAPEYAIRGFLSFKNDVFSFGVLLLEIISGRRNHDLQFDPNMQELLKLAWRLEQEGRLIELVDETVGSFPQELALRYLRIGLLCTQECLEDRPKMPYVLLMLSTNSSSIPPLGRPAYLGDIDNEVQMSIENESFTHNSISISLQDGR